MSSSGSDLSEVQLNYLHTVLEHFQHEGEWPEFYPLSRKLVRQMKIRDVEASLPPGFVFGRDSYTPNRRVTLTVFALRVLGAAKELDAFIRAVHFCLRRHFDPDDLHPELASGDLLDDLGMSSLMIKKVHLLLQQEGLLGSGRADQSGDEWRYEIADRVEVFEEIDSIDDYLDIRQQQRREPQDSVAIGPPFQGNQNLEIPGLELPTTVIRDDQLRGRCEDLLAAQAAYDRVVREACVVLEDRVRAAAKLGSNIVGTALMEMAFSAKRPLLRLSGDEKEQRGAMELYRGLMAFFRNAAGHRVIDGYSRDDALRIVIWVDALLGMIELAENSEDVRSHGRLDE